MNNKWKWTPVPYGKGFYWVLIPERKTA